MRGWARELVWLCVGEGGNGGVGWGVGVTMGMKELSWADELNFEWTYFNCIFNLNWIPYSRTKTFYCRCKKIRLIIYSQ